MATKKKIAKKVPTNKKKAQIKKALLKKEGLVTESPMPKAGKVTPKKKANKKKLDKMEDDRKVVHGIVHPRSGNHICSIWDKADELMEKNGSVSRKDMLEALPDLKTNTVSAQFRRWAIYNGYPTSSRKSKQA